MKVEIDIPENLDVPSLLAEVSREIGQRKRVYPRLIERGTLTPNAADKQVERMTMIGLLLTKLNDQIIPDLFGSEAA